MTDKQPERLIFTTFGGNVIDITPVSSVLVQLVRQANPLPPVPTYKVTTVSGAIEELPHDETTLEVPNDLPASKANRELWINYTLKRDKAREDMSQKITRLYMLKGVLSNPPEDDYWVKEQAAYGVTVPEDKDERKLHWLRTEVLTHYEDMTMLITTLMGMAGAKEETVQAIRALFRNTIQRVASGLPTNSKEPLGI